MELRVHVTSSSINTEFPEFTGKLYKAIDNPREGELTYTSEELQKLNLENHPICLEHDYKLGKIGYIRASRYNHPWLYIEGVIDTPNKKLRESIRSSLKSGRLSELSIGFHGSLTDNGEYYNKVFDEASLVERGHYEGTKIVSVCASKQKSSLPQITILKDTEDLSDLLTKCMKPEKMDCEENNSSDRNLKEYFNKEEKFISTADKTPAKVNVFVKATEDNIKQEKEQPKNIIMESSQKQENIQESASRPTDMDTNIDMDTNMDNDIDMKSEVSEEVNTSKMTPQQLENYYKSQLDAVKKQKERELEELSKHTAQLEEFKRQQDEEYKKSKQREALEVKETFKTLGYEEDDPLFGMVDKLAQSRDNADFFEAIRKVTTDRNVKDETLRKANKELSALKRKQKNVAVTASRRQDISKRVRSLAKNNNGTINPVGSDLLELVKSKPGTVSVKSSGMVDKAKQYTNQTVYEQEESQEESQEEYAEEEFNDSGNPLLEQWKRTVYAQCRFKSTADRMIERGNANAGAFKHSLSQAGPELFLKLLEMSNQNENQISF